VVGFTIGNKYGDNCQKEILVVNASLTNTVSLQKLYQSYALTSVLLLLMFTDLCFELPNIDDG
jgi:hypothetical protein